MTKSIQDFLRHVKEQGRITDSTATDGEDKLYYELDAAIVDALVQELVKQETSGSFW